MPVSSRATVVATIAATTVTALPVALVGSMAVLIRSELEFSQTQLGVLIAAFFGAAAFASVPVSRRLSSASAASVLAWCAAGSGGVMLVMGVVTSAWWQLLVFMAFAGAASVATQLAANELIASRVLPHQQGRAFGLKQAAVPLGTLLAGLMMPAIGLSLGWRWAFLGAAALALIVAILVPARSAVSQVPTTAAAVYRRTKRRPWIILAIAAGCAGAAGNSLGPFVVEYAVTSGFTTAEAGLLLAAGAGAGVLTRVAAGVVADRIGRGALLLMIGLLTCGVVGIGLVAIASNATVLTVGVLMGFSGAWGWAGVLLLAIARVANGSVASAMGIVAVGPLLGAVVGPPSFGWVIEHVSWTAAWFGMIVVVLAAVSLVIVSRRELKLMLVERAYAQGASASEAVGPRHR
jgi:MFS family permease